MSAATPEATGAAGTDGPRDDLAPRTRFFRVGACWALLFFAAPGVLFGAGSVVLATLALVPWALSASRPGKRAFWIEWLAAGAGISAACYWTTHVLWITLLVVAIVPGLYMAVAGVVLRVLVRRFPLWIATPVAWVGLETLRYVVDPPFGFGWTRLGHHASTIEWLSGSARVWGVGGISFALASIAGGIAYFVAIRATGPRALATPRGQAANLGTAWALAVGPLALACMASLATSPPATVVGPRVMLVQPAFEQRRKMTSPEPHDLLRESIDLTRRGLDEARAAGEREPEIVAWGEAMLPYRLGDRDLARDEAAGARSRPWADPAIGPREIELLGRFELEAVQHSIFGTDGKGRVLPARASFVSGVDLIAARDGVIEDWNAVLAWSPKGERLGWVSKIHLVPGGETMCGLERFEIVRSLAFELANYIPDLAWRREPRVLELPRAAPPPAGTDAAAAWRVGISVCFDNAFEDPYTDAVRAGPLDFHLVCSNEAWYEESFEYDQMLAFTRLAAIATGRSIVRATNAGISSVFGPDGRLLARLAVGGKDRMVAGTLRADVPVPIAAERAARTPFVVLEHAWLAVWLGLAAVLTLCALVPRRPRA